MIAGLALLAVLASQCLLVGRAWLGAWAPDPGVLLLAGVALGGRRRLILPTALLVGWSRAVALIEPAGGHVLCAWAATTVLVGLRHGLREFEVAGFVLAALLAALVWWAMAGLLGLVVTVPLTAGRELLLGAALAPLLARAVIGRGDRYERIS